MVRSTGKTSHRGSRALISLDPRSAEPDAPIQFEATVPGELTLAGVLTAVDDRFVLTSLSIQGHPVGNEVSASAIHRLPVAQIVADVRAMVIAAGRLTWEGRTPEEYQAAKRRAQRAARSHLKRGRTGYGDDHYRRIAFAYLDLLDQGRTRGILGDLAAAESRRAGREVPVETIRTWVNQARQRQFLTPGEPGRAGATPGPRLLPQSEGNDVHG